MKVTAYIHDSDFDCSELVRMSWRAVGVLPYGSYMWTGNERELLTSNGFKYASLSNPQVGDVLWREGHTAIIVGPYTMVEAAHDESGGITGRIPGDQTGDEIRYAKYRASDWTKCLRYAGPIKDYEGIPIRTAAALVAEHIATHDAHGYSQPNRAGNGKLEKITISYDDSESDLIVTKGDFTVMVTEAMNVRSAPQVTPATLCGNVAEGTRIKCDQLVLRDGRVWVSYLSGVSRRYMVLGPIRYAKAIG